MSTLTWILPFVALVVALAAHARARRLSRRLETLTQMYWELKYEHSRLKAQVTRLDPEAQRPAEEAEPASASAPTVGYVPLSSLKKQ